MGRWTTGPSPFRQLATLDPEMDIGNKYHNMVEEEIKIINEIVADKNIPNTNSDEIMKAIRSINRGKSADYHGLTIEHIANAGKDMENLLLVITNEIFRQGNVLIVPHVQMMWKSGPRTNFVVQKGTNQA